MGSWGWKITSLRPAWATAWDLISKNPNRKKERFIFAQFISAVLINNSELHLIRISNIAQASIGLLFFSIYYSHSWKIDFFFPQLYIEIIQRFPSPLQVLEFCLVITHVSLMWTHEMNNIWSLSLEVLNQLYLWLAWWWGLSRLEERLRVHDLIAKTSLCISDWLQSHRDPSASAPWVVKLKASITTPGVQDFKKKNTIFYYCVWVYWACMYVSVYLLYNTWERWEESLDSPGTGKDHLIPPVWGQSGHHEWEPQNQNINTCNHKMWFSFLRFSNGKGFR